MSVSQSLKEIKLQIEKACEKVGRNPEEITIIGVTKYVTIERTKELLEAGVIDVGENRAEGLLEKYEAIGDDAKWHFIGTLQSRKVKDVIDEVHMIHSLDRLSVAKQINNRSDRTVDCFVQVNVSGEASKHGLEPEDLQAFINDLAQYEKVRVVGLMTMAPHIKDEAKLRETFKHLRQLRNDVQERNLKHAPCHYLSMGMSNDFDIAIEEGATHIRIGTKLVGNEKE